MSEIKCNCYQHLLTSIQLEITSEVKIIALLVQTAPTREESSIDDNKTYLAAYVVSLIG